MFSSGTTYQQRKPLWGRCPALETPTGYSATLDQALVQDTNDTAVSLTFANAEPEADYTFSITSDGGAGSVTGTGRIATATDQITGIDLSGLPDGDLTLTVILTNPAGNAGDPVATQTAMKDTPGCPAIGDICLDGSVNAGITPDGNVRMYAAAADLPSLLPWNNGNVNTGNTWNGLTNRNTGQANTETLIALDADTETPGTQPYQAAQACADLSVHGHDDWYLPAMDELKVIYDNRLSISGLKTDAATPWPQYNYWSSTELQYSNSRDTAVNARLRETDAWSADANNNRRLLQSVRCVRY